MHCFQVKLGSDTGTVIFGVEYFKSLKGQENLTTAENLQLKTRVENVRFLSWITFFFFWKVRYSKHRRNDFEKG